MRGEGWVPQRVSAGSSLYVWRNILAFITSVMGKPINSMQKLWREKFINECYLLL